MFRSKAVEPTIIGSGATITGNIKVTGQVQVDGTIDGVLEVDGQVSIGPKGRIKGEVIADDLAVGGHVEGKLTARGHLHIVATGQVKGDIRYQSLQVDKGAVLDGRTIHGGAAEEPASEPERNQKQTAQSTLAPPARAAARAS